MRLAEELEVFVVLNICYSSKELNNRFELLNFYYLIESVDLIKSMI